MDVALELLAERGVAGLTMRELSSRLGVALGATYRYVRSKHELLRLVGDKLYDGIQPGDPSLDGYGQAKAVMVQVHAVLGQYPGMATYIGQHLGEFSSETVSKLALDALCSEGMSMKDAVRVMQAMSVYAAGQLLTGGSAGSEAFADGLDLLLAGARQQLSTR